MDSIRMEIFSSNLTQMFTELSNVQNPSYPISSFVEDIGEGMNRIQL